MVVTEVVVEVTTLSYPRQRLAHKVQLRVEYAHEVVWVPLAGTGIMRLVIVGRVGAAAVGEHN